jgi:RecA/RadA recombinase
LGSKKRQRLELVAKQLQQRFGPQAVKRGEQAFDRRMKIGAISTGFAELDAALDGSGGIPTGRATEILSLQTAGSATLALKVMANAQTGGGLVTYLDLAETFDPDYAARCGLSLSRSRFLLVTPATAAEALEIGLALVTRRSSQVLVFDAIAPDLVAANEAQHLARLLRQLPQALANSNSVLIFLTLLESSRSGDVSYPPGFAALPHYTSLRILLRKERWLIRRNDIRGYESRAIVLSNKLGSAGRSAKLAITFNGVVKGDGT